MHGNIQADSVELGMNVVIEDDVVIRGVNGNAKKISIGDNVYIGKSVQIICDDFSLGDYSKIHHHTNVHGYKPCHIGHNAWIGQYSIIDCIGGVSIGNNCGIGAHSQLWSHIKYGDMLEGCRFLNEKPLIIGDDVWFVGHCIVSPIEAKDKAMALVGSVITKDMEYNTIYAGSPAKSISDKAGFQFEQVPPEKKIKMMQEYLLASGIDGDHIKIVSEESAINFDDAVSYFNVSARKYTKKRTAAETAFMKYLLPEKAKFIPYQV